MIRPCEHCDNPDKSKWTSDCRYVGAFSSRKSFVDSTFDAPCACDDFDAWMVVRTRHEQIGWTIGFFALAVIAAALFLV